MGNIIETRGLAKQFGDVTAVGGVDFEVGEGELFGLLGPNGAGKTTTVRMLTGVLEPTRGTASIQGHLLFVSGIFLPIAEMPAWARWVAPLSPLSYAGDLIRGAFGQPVYFASWLSPAMLVCFTAVLLWGAGRFHRRWRTKGL